MSLAEDMVEDRPVVGFPGYEIGLDGRVWSCRKGAQWKPVKTYAIQGYLAVGLVKDGRQHTVYVHRLLLEAFIGPCPPGMQACHNDGNKANNRLSNLRWDSVLANAADRRRHGTQIKGERAHRAKLRADDVRVIRELIASGLTRAEIGRRFGVTDVAIFDIAQGRSWRHVT